MCQQTIGVARGPERRELMRAERSRLGEGKPELGLEPESLDLQSRGPKPRLAGVAENPRGTQMEAGMLLGVQSCVFVFQKRCRSYQSTV
jgi:hypothetical protein